MQKRVRHPLSAAICLIAVCVVGLAAALPGPVADVPQNPVAPSDLWIVPASTTSDGGPGLTDVVSLLKNEKPADALRALASASFHPDLGGYALFYEARALLALERYGEARRVADRLLATKPPGSLREASAWLSAEIAEAGERWGDAAAALEALAALPTASRAEVALRLGRAAEKAGNRALAEASYLRLYYELPTTSQAGEAQRSMAALGASLTPTAADWSRTLDRAERLYAGGRWVDARKAFVAVRGFTAADSEARARVDLRLAQSDLHQRRYPAARDALTTLAASSAPADVVRDAKYFNLATLRGLKREDEYIAGVHAFVAAYATDLLAEAALNELGTHFILANEDARAAEVFRDLYGRFPTGAFADRAAWKAGWWSYKGGDYAETIRLFESAAVGLRRADYRPSWLYWAARAHVHLAERDAAAAGFRQTIADYRNSYYGRQAARELERLLSASRPAGAGAVAPASRMLPPTLDPGPAPANAAFVERLLSAGLHAAAVLELRAFQRESGTSSPRLEATLAYALNRQGQLRPAITAMRRAYPQFMAAGGEALPTDILKVIFPVDHWDLIRRQAATHKLDPYLMAALIAQESTFQADVRSSANAWGLMQVIPATGQRYASKLGIRPFSTRRLTEPDVNVRIGMTYFAELLRRFGDPAPALAAYNAGESRVARWLAERPGVERDEFIDDIPFPETQNYVKRVLGTAEDYRLLYGGQALPHL